MKKIDLAPSEVLIKNFQMIFPTLSEYNQKEVLEFILALIIKKPKKATNQKPKFKIKIGTTREEMYRINLLETLRYCKGNQNKTAKMLGVSTKTVYNMIRYYGFLQEVRTLRPQNCEIWNFQKRKSDPKAADPNIKDDPVKRRLKDE